MRYLLISLVAFMLFALPAFAYEPPTEPVTDSVIINVDIAAYMELVLLEDNLDFEINYEDCETGVWSDVQELNYYICVNGDWYVEAYFEGSDAGDGEWDMDWPTELEVYVNQSLMLPYDEGGNTEIDSGGIGCWWSYTNDEGEEPNAEPWSVQVWAPWLEKGNYTGELFVELWDP